MKFTHAHSRRVAAAAVGTAVLGLIAGVGAASGDVFTLSSPAPIVPIFIEAPGLAPSAPAAPVEPHQRAPLTDDVRAVAEANNRFGLQLYQQLARRAEPDEGVLFSPLSASAALGMIYAGAAGNTAEQMRHALGYDAAGADRPHLGMGSLGLDLNAPREGYELRLANRVFVQDGMPLKEGFLGTLADDYRSPVEQLNFYGAPEEARQRINAWAAEATNDRIQNALPEGSITPVTRLAIANALYFNGDWKQPFLEENTTERAFHHADGSQSLAPTMRQQSRFRYGAYDDYQLLEMPYAGDDLSMLVLLPDPSTSVAALEQSLEYERLQADIDAAAFREVVVSLPRFEFAGGDSLNAGLQALGMTDAFHAAAADFSGMADEPLFIDSVQQQTFISVNEHGAEAAAVTIGTARTVSAQLPYQAPTLFTADRAFLYAIRDTHTGALLFMGRMTAPEEGASALTVPEPAAAMLLVASAAAWSAGCRPRKINPADLLALRGRKGPTGAARGVRPLVLGR